MDTIAASPDLTALLLHIWHWILANLITYSSLIQTGWLLIALLIGLLTTRLTQPFFNRLHDTYSHYTLRLCITAMRSVLAPLIALMIMLFYPTIADTLGVGTKLARLYQNLLGAWVVIHFISSFIRYRALAQWISWIIWGFAALNTFGLLGSVLQQMDELGFNLGNTHISVLTIIRAFITCAAVLWSASIFSRLSEHHIQQYSQLTPSLRVLITKILRSVFFMFAVIIGLNTLGIDLTSLAVFSGAIGVGIGFGLQKVVSNFVSGIILLLDRSIKPGDVIAINNSFGWVNRLGARHVSIITRDGKEHLIPNELLITERVENWSYSDHNVRLKIPFAISIHSDARYALELMLKVASETPRILKSPTPNALLMSIAGAAAHLELRVWINDPANGISNVSSDLLLRIWDTFKAEGILLPSPIYDVNIKSGTLS